MLHAAKLGDDCIVAVDGHGLVQVLETGHFALHEYANRFYCITKQLTITYSCRSLKEWKKMVGDDSSKALQVNMHTCVQVSTCMYLAIDDLPKG